jgi:hypothetical protein
MGSNVMMDLNLRYNFMLDADGRFAGSETFLDKPNAHFRIHNAL